MIAEARHELRLMAVALQYFTRLPMPRVHGFDERWLADAVRWFPLAGLVVGVLVAAVLWAASIVLPWPIACLLALVASLVVTGAFHEDGLADTFDALGGYVGRERALEIMRDSRVGTYGAAALVLSLLLRWQVLVLLPLQAAIVFLIAVHPLARTGAALLMAGLPYVRLDADAKAKPVAQPMGARQGVATLVVGLLPLSLIVVLNPGFATAIAAAVVAVLFVHVGCRRWYRRRLGGYTGDGLGCAEQLAEIASGLAMVAVLQATG